MYNRLLKLPKKSFFMFGPRGVGKSTWLLHQKLGHAALKVNLLHSSQFLDYKRNPSLLREQVEALRKGSWVIIDEIQKLPELLDEVHSLLFDHQGKYHFALSGSSARKIKRSQGNMLAGRAIMRNLFALSCLEMPDFSLESALKYGLLPLVAVEKKRQGKIEILDTYVKTYLEEEIQQEALVRHLQHFYRFLEVVAIVNGEILNMSNIARDVGVARSTVQGYFDILCDTLIGFYLPSLKLKAKVKEIAHAKFYLFDCGFQRALSRRLRENPSQFEKGKLFEAYFINEIRAINAYFNMGGQLSYWRTESGTEVDLIWSCGKKHIAFEIKYGQRWLSKYNRGLNILLEKKLVSKAYGIYTGSTSLKQGRVEVLPFKQFLDQFSSKKR